MRAAGSGKKKNEKKIRKRKKHSGIVVDHIAWIEKDRRPEKYGHFFHLISFRSEKTEDKKRTNKTVKKAMNTVKKWEKITTKALKTAKNRD